MALHWLKNLYLQCSEYRLISTAERSICCLMHSDAHWGKAGIARKVMSGVLGSYIWGPLWTPELFLLSRAGILATIESAFFFFFFPIYMEGNRGPESWSNLSKATQQVGGRTGIRIQASSSFSRCIFLQTRVSHTLVAPLTYPHITCTTVYFPFFPFKRSL